MFTDFFLQLKRSGIPVSISAYLSLQKALSAGLITSIYQLYVCARSIMVKSERYFDLYDTIFSSYFKDAEDPFLKGIIPDDDMAALLEVWLKDSKQSAADLNIDELQLMNKTPEELIEYFQDRLLDQKERHDGGTRWIGTGGTSPTGHSGYHPTGMRVGGASTRRSALKVAGERRFKDYTDRGPLSEAAMMEALKRLKNLVPHGPRDHLDIDQTIYDTMRSGGEIQMAFKQRHKDRLKVILAIDNGGISMDPHVGIVKTLFDHANSFFKDLKIVYFHNAIYETVWEDPQRFRKPVEVEALLKSDKETRLIIVGDASMSPYELLYRNGTINVEEKANAPGLYHLKELRKVFPYSVWLNPVSDNLWEYTSTINVIADIFPMFTISLQGLEKAVSSLMVK
ncbi:MAG: hypothetical protein JEY99_07720 [Spirochaetales bacterium]|nr:hypothetical protein [Spirochaetales bacterium]